MTENHDHNHDHAALEEEVALFALEVLDAASRARMAAHIGGCARCAGLLDDYRAVVGLLPYALPAQHPPPAAWAALLARVRQRRHRRWQQRLPLPDAAALPAAVLRRLRPLRWVAVGVLLAGLLLWNVRLQLGDAGRSREIDRLARLPHGQVAVLIGAGATLDASGRLYLDAEDEHGALVVAGLAPLPPEQVYQLWFIRGDQSRVSGGVFRVDERGEAAVLVTVPGALDQYVAVAVTAEPAGGSPSPTGREVLVASL